MVAGALPPEAPGPAEGYEDEDDNFLTYDGDVLTWGGEVEVTYG